jgi:hypothetical protein
MEEIIEKEIPLISHEMEEMNKEIMFLRNELAESWWSQNGWKFKDKDKFSSFRFSKECFLNMTISSRKGSTSAEILTEYFIGYRNSRERSNSNA